MENFEKVCQCWARVEVGISMVKEASGDMCSMMLSEISLAAHGHLLKERMECGLQVDQLYQL